MKKHGKTIAEIMGCGSSTNERPADDFFETPEWATEQLCVVEDVPRRIWEPCLGRGAIARVLRRHGIEVIESDLNPRSGQLQVDFLQTDEAPAGAILTNPPYKYATEWIRHAYDLRLGYLALLLKADFLNADQRRKLVNLVVTHNLVRES
jgi:methylase of polypeptide subunit release factors